MIDFGYTLTKDRQFDYDHGDFRFLRLVRSIEPSLDVCIGCGSCTATCSASQFTNFNIRKLHTVIRRGDPESIKAELKKCMFCGKCQLVCPRGVNLRNLILAMNRAIEQLG
ncbi:MAG: 4Fe-4S dicluster domain-containing protein [Bacteroidetes bacterium]|nr:4Fe-4S dicluster domain-containing protein [Bacteroidota bacterium]